MNAETVNSPSDGRATGQDLPPALLRWISVSERLPERYAEVLACTRLNNAFRGIQSLLSFNGAKWTYEYGAHIYTGEVTHWMPLPPPPGEADELIGVGDDPLATQAEVRNNSLGKLDEFIAHNAGVHLEQMNDGHWWLGVEMRDRMFWHINFSTKRNTPIHCLAESEQHEPSR